jgi:hypothetical protein
MATMWFQSIMSGVGAQGDPCTATIFWYIVRHHLIYSASSPVPLTECSVLHNGINIVAWFHKNVYLSDECWIQLKPLPCFSFRFFVVHISPITIRELNSHHQQSPMRVEGVHTAGCCPLPWRDRLRHCYYHLSAMQPSARCLTPWLRWARTLFAVLGRYPLRDEDA